MPEKCAARGDNSDSIGGPFDQTNSRYGSGCNSVKKVFGKLLVVFLNK